MFSVRKSQTAKRSKQHGLPAGKAAQRGVLAHRMLGMPMKYGSGAGIYGEGEPVEYVYEIVTGAVRTVKMLSGGRRKIGGFHFAGEIFGLEDGNEHALSAEAVVPVTVRVIKRQTLVHLAAGDRKLAEELLTMAMRDVARAQRHTLMLVLTAQERVSSFLVEMAERISVGDLLHLPMSRLDIADYLGLTAETVSRTITSLESASTIRLPNSRDIVVRNRPALDRGTGVGLEVVVL